MTLPSRIWISKVTVTGLWFCLCLAMFWGEPSRVFLFGVLFGIMIWHGTDKFDHRVSPRTYATITGALLIPLVVLILVLKIGVYPILNALITLAFGAAATRSKFIAHKENTKEVEQAGSCDAEEAV